MGCWQMPLTRNRILPIVCQSRLTRKVSCASSPGQPSKQLVRGTGALVSESCPICQPELSFACLGGKLAFGVSTPCSHKGPSLTRSPGRHIFKQELFCLVLPSHQDLSLNSTAACVQASCSQATSHFLSVWLNPCPDHTVHASFFTALTRSLLMKEAFIFNLFIYLFLLLH